MKKNDFRLIVIVLVFAIAGFIMLQMTKEGGASVIVTIDGKEYGTYSLEKDATIQIESDYGTNELVIKDKKAKVEEASCPDKLCVHQHAINKTGETIVCLPNKVVVTVENGEESDVDTVAQ